MNLNDYKTPCPLEVKEGVEGYYRYHLAAGPDFVSLCGARVMGTSIPRSAWGSKSHLNEKWCEKCKALAATDPERKEPSRTSA